MFQSKVGNQSESEELKSRADTFPRIMASICPSGNGEDSGEIFVSLGTLGTQRPEIEWRTLQTWEGPFALFILQSG